MNKTRNPRTVYLHVRVSVKEKKATKKQSKQRGFESEAEYVRDLIRKDGDNGKSV